MNQNAEDGGQFIGLVNPQADRLVQARQMEASLTARAEWMLANPKRCTPQDFNVVKAKLVELDEEIRALEGRPSSRPNRGSFERGVIQAKAAGMICVNGIDFGITGSID